MDAPMCIGTDHMSLLMCCHSYCSAVVTRRSPETCPVECIGTLCIPRLPKHDQELPHTHTHTTPAVYTFSQLAVGLLI